MRRSRAADRGARRRVPREPHDDRQLGVPVRLEIHLPGLVTAAERAVLGRRADAAWPDRIPPRRCHRPSSSPDAGPGRSTLAPDDRRRPTRRPGDARRRPRSRPPRSPARVGPGRARPAPDADHAAARLTELQSVRSECDRGARAAGEVVDLAVVNAPGSPPSSDQLSWVSSPSPGWLSTIQPTARPAKIAVRRRPAGRAAERPTDPVQLGRSATAAGRSVPAAGPTRRPTSGEDLPSSCSARPPRAASITTASSQPATPW